MLQELSSLGFIWTSHKYNTDKYLNKHFQDLYINIIFYIKKFLYFLKWNRKWLCYFRKIHKRKLQTQDYKTSHILHVSPHLHFLLPWDFTWGCYLIKWDNVISNMNPFLHILSVQLMELFRDLLGSSRSCVAAKVKLKSSAAAIFLNGKTSLVKRVTKHGICFLPPNVFPLDSKL